MSLEFAGVSSSLKKVELNPALRFGSIVSSTIFIKHFCLLKWFFLLLVIFLKCRFLFYVKNRLKCFINKVFILLKHVSTKDRKNKLSYKKYSLRLKLKIYRTTYRILVRRLVLKQQYSWYNSVVDNQLISQRWIVVF